VSLSAGSVEAASTGDLTGGVAASVAVVGVPSAVVAAESWAKAGTERTVSPADSSHIDLRMVILPIADRVLLPDAFR
jgi:hypothetical protein